MNDPGTSTAVRDSFEWWTAESVLELYNRIIEAGPGRCRLERRQTDKGGTLRVVAEGVTASPTDGEDPPDINDSRNCPPICP